MGEWTRGSQPVETGWYWVIIECNDSRRVWSSPVLFRESGVWQEMIEPIAFMKIEEPTLASYCEAEATDADLENTSIDELDLSVRPYNCLKRAGIFTIGELRRYTFQDIAALRNMGRTSMLEIRAKIEAYGLHLDEKREIRGWKVDNDDYVDAILPPQIAVILFREGIHTIGDLKTKSWEKIDRIFFLNEKQKDLIKKATKAHGIKI